MVENKDLSDLAAGMKENKLNELNTFIGDTFHQLVELIPKSTMPENVFKEYFVEFFFNIAKYDNSSPLILKWLEISGGPYNEVDIIDNRGAVLFTVPGISSRPIVNDEGLSNKNFHGIASNYEQKSNRLHVEGINYLALELQSVPTMVTAGTLEDINKWKIIYNFYYGNKVETKTHANEMVNSLLSDAFDYE